MKSLLGLSIPYYSYMISSLILSSNMLLIKFLNSNKSLFRALYCEVRPNSKNFGPNILLAADSVSIVNSFNK